MGSPWSEYLPDGHGNLKNVMFAPLNVNGKTVGLMGLANKSSGFTQADAHIATVFGDLAAIELANSRYLDQLNEKNQALEHALSEIRTLRGLLPICSHCKSIRDDEGLWTRVDTYLAAYTDANFTHGLCRECIREPYPEDADQILEELGASRRPTN